MSSHRLDRSRNQTSRGLSLLICAGIIGCGTGSGDSAVCREPAPSCGTSLVSAVDTFSEQGCEGAIENAWCGVYAQALAECLHEAAVCVQIGTTRDAVTAALAASVCAEEHAAWDDCFANGNAGGGGGDDDDDD